MRCSHAVEGVPEALQTLSDTDVDALTDTELDEDHTPRVTVGSVPARPAIRHIPSDCSNGPASWPFTEADVGHD